MRICLLTEEKIDDFNPAVYLNNFDWDFVTVEAPIVEFVLLCPRISREVSSLSEITPTIPDTSTHPPHPRRLPWRGPSTECHADRAY